MKASVTHLCEGAENKIEEIGSQKWVEGLILSSNHKYVIGDISTDAKFFEKWYEKSEEPIVSMNIGSVGVQGTTRSEMSEFARLHRYFRSAYIQYASFKCLAGAQIGRFLTLRPQPLKFRLFSRQTMEAYWTYAD